MTIDLYFSFAGGHILFSGWLAFRPRLKESWEENPVWELLECLVSTSWPLFLVMICLVFSLRPVTFDLDTSSALHLSPSLSRIVFHQATCFTLIAVFLSTLMLIQFICDHSYYLSLS